MFEKALVLGIYSITPVHAGSGTELSVVDLPIQRERHTGFPVIWGQSLKGVLRSYYERNVDKEKAEEIFGPPTERAHEHAGAISLGDAKVLLFPVRSLKGVFAYITSPLVIERLKKDLEYVGIEGSDAEPLKKLEEDKAVVSGSSKLNLSDGRVVLEEFALDATEGEEAINQLAAFLNKISPVEIDKDRIAIVSDDVFSYFVQNATEVAARIQIDAGTGTVKDRALWYEEYLPSDTLLYSVVAIGKPRKENSKVGDAEKVAKALMSSFSDVFLQIGGNETVGKGFVKVKVMGNENTNSGES
ncbi:type III-B CRISPR module RAMP protein Cmr4 [Palaeococcus sp. (in: euryarchaeotes)]